MAGYKGFTPSQAKAHKRYMESVATIQVRTTAEHREEIKAYAEKHGESVNALVLRALKEAMERQP